MALTMMQQAPSSFIDGIVLVRRDAAADRPTLMKFIMLQAVANALAGAGAVSCVMLYHL